jgi:hypothetical protein
MAWYRRMSPDPDGLVVVVVRGGRPGPVQAATSSTPQAAARRRAVARVLDMVIT